MTPELSARHTATPNAPSPNLMTVDERLDEVSAMLALGVIRLNSRQSSHLPADQRESSLDIADDESSHGSVNNRYGVQ